MSQFASDNNAGICPVALEALAQANAGHAPAYGDDDWTKRAQSAIARLFETECEVFFAFNGTAANALALAQVCRSYEAVICHASSHVATDEAGAPSFFGGGVTLKTTAEPLAKLTAAAVDRLAGEGRGVHHVKPRAVSITQSSELGTVYAPEEVRAISAAARRHGLVLHMDGARFANAIAHLRAAPADVTWRAGVDILSFGGVKNGLAAGEAIVFFDRALARDFGWRLKQAGHLNSKMRLVTAPWATLIESGTWLANARHANAMAAAVGAAMTEAGLVLLAPVEANGVFVTMPPEVQTALRAKGWRFYTFLGESGCRFVCAWDTSPETVARLADDLKAATRL